MVEEKNDARGPPTALDRLRWKVARAGRKNDVAGIVVFRRKKLLESCDLGDGGSGSLIPRGVLGG